MKGMKPRKFDYIPRYYEESSDSESTDKKRIRVKRGVSRKIRNASFYKIMFLIFIILYFMYFLKNNFQ